MKRVTVCVLVLVLALVFFSFTLAAEKTSEEKPEKQPDATLKLSEGQVALGIGWSWGKGVLKFKGKDYPFKVEGLSVGDVGVTMAEGKVYNLNNLVEFSGNYVAATAAATLVVGAGATVLQNDKNVVIHLFPKTEGFNLKLAGEGIKFRLEEDKKMNSWTMLGKPALILIHMQHAITHPEGKVAFLHAKATRESGVIPRQQALLKAFREKKLPVIYVNAFTDPKSKLPAYGRFWGAIQKTGVNLLGSKDVEVISDLAPMAGEPVLYNWPFGIFTRNKLQEVLDGLGVETLVVAGVATDMAVLTAVFQASDMLYNLIVPKDASTSGNPKFHETSMEMIDAIALVTTTDDVIAHL